MNLDLEKIEADLFKLADQEKDTGIEGYDEIIIDDDSNFNIDDDDYDYDDEEDDDNNNISSNKLDTSSLFGVPDVNHLWKKKKY